ncbi:hypothetical protein ABL78_0492 [Leptomonas seymouri]|uniref:Uncharacterized protein n=1 Tax=Leptomonas seymouri TaxID=5684 RepID=A0A0N0P8W3_LEPSE|nr:hypothetical protein ABL78_0492 [Leptomonas seymouri]|eukprot:KPI90416.1 hypothetical protein ABL78_0492 [Leptomonas seymouri]
MLDLVQSSSATARGAHTIDRTNARPPFSPIVAAKPQGSSARSIGTSAPVLTASSLDSGLPLTLPNPPSSGRQISSQRHQPSMSDSNINSSPQSGAATHFNASFNGDVSANAEQREPYTVPPLPLPLTPADVTSRQNSREANASHCTREQLQREELTKGSAAAKFNAAATRASPPALTTLAGVTSTVSMPSEKGQGLTRSATSMLPPILADTASAPNSSTVVAAAGATVTSTKSSTSSNPHAALLESEWADYNVYLRLSAMLLPQRSLQDRVAELCCASTKSASGHKRLICLDNVFSFLMHGSAVMLPQEAPTETSASSRQLSLSVSPCDSDEAQRVCFPLFCLLGAKLCALAEHSRAIRSIHTPTPPVRVSLALHPQAKGCASTASPSRESQSTRRLYVLLLFAEQLINAYPDFPPELLYTTSPGGVVVSAPPPEAAGFWHSWQATPREARQSAPYDAVWSVITLQRFAVLMQRWGVSPAAAMRKLCVPASGAASVEFPHPPETGETTRPVVLRQLLQPVTGPNSCLSISTPQAAMSEEEDSTAVATAATQHRKGESALIATATINSTPSLSGARQHQPYPPYTRQQQQPRQHSTESNSLSFSGTATSSSGWDCASSLKAAVLGEGQYTPAAAAAVRSSAARSRRARHEATLTSSSLGTPLVSDDRGVMDDTLTVDAEGGHPYNASRTADAKVMLDQNIECNHYGQIHKYNVPFPPPLPQSAGATLTAVNDNIASFLRSFARSGGVVPPSVPNGTSIETWNTKRGASPAYMPSPPKNQPQKQQRRHSNHNSTVAGASASTVLSTRTERRQYSEVFTPLSPRPMTAEVQHQLRVPMDWKESALHPYSVAAGAVPSSKKHRKAHARGGSSPRRHQAKKDEGRAAATRAPRSAGKAENSGKTDSSAGGNATEVLLHATGTERPSENEKPAAKADRCGKTSSARLRTEQVNAYMHNLLEAAAARKREDASVANAIKESANTSDPQYRIRSTGVSGAAPVTSAPSFEGELHDQSGRSNLSANANSLNGGRPVKDVMSFASVDAASSHVNAAPEVNNGISQRVNAAVQHVPAPPPPESFSHLRPLNPHTNILQSWESSMNSQPDVGWDSAVANAAHPPPPPLFPPEHSHPDETALLREVATLIPSTASSLSQLAVNAPPMCQATAQGRGATSMPALHQESVEGPARESNSDSLSRPTASYPSPVIPKSEIFRTMDGAGTTDKAFLLVSHTPEHGLVVTSLQFPRTSAHTTDRSVSGALPSVVAVEEVQGNDSVNGVPSLSTGSPPAPAVNSSDECSSLLIVAKESNGDWHGSYLRVLGTVPFEHKAHAEPSAEAGHGMPPKDSAKYIEPNPANAGVMAQLYAAISSAALTPSPGAVAASHMQGSESHVTAVQQCPEVLVAKHSRASCVFDGATATKSKSSSNPDTTVPVAAPLVLQPLASPPVLEMPVPTVAAIVPLASVSLPPPRQGATASLGDSPLSDSAGQHITDAVKKLSENVLPGVFSSLAATMEVQGSWEPPPNEKQCLESSVAPPRLSIAAQLRDLVARVLQAAGRGYLARRQLGANVALCEERARGARLEGDALYINRAPSYTSAHSFPATLGPDAAAAVNSTRQPYFQLLTVVPACADSIHSNDAGNAASAAAVAAHLSHGLSLLPASVTESTTTPTAHPPPLTVFSASGPRAAPRSPVTRASLRVAGTPATRSSKGAEISETSYLVTVTSSPVNDRYNLNGPSLNHFPSQASANCLQHPSNVSPAQRLIAIYGGPGSSVMENSSSSWMPPAPGKGTVGADRITSYETGALESTLPGTARSVEQRLDASHLFPLFLPWAEDGMRGSRDGMMSVHTLPPPKEESSCASAGDVEGLRFGSGSQRPQHKDRLNFTASVIEPLREGVTETAPPPSLMKPIVVPHADRLTEDTTSSILHEATDDDVNLPYSRLDGGESCTVAFLDETVDGTSANSTMRSNSQDPAGSHHRSSPGRSRYSNSRGNTRAMSWAVCVLLLQRLGRGYLARQQLSQRCCSEEDDYFGPLMKKALLHDPSLLFLPPAVTAETAAGKIADNTCVKAEGASRNQSGGDAHGICLPSAAVGLHSEASLGAPPLQTTAASAAPQVAPPAVVAAPPVANPGAISTILGTSDCASFPSPPVNVLGPPLSPFQVPCKGFAPFAQSPGPAYMAEGANARAMLATSSDSASKSVKCGGSAATASASAVDNAPTFVDDKPPFVTPDNLRFLMLPTQLSPTIQPALQHSSLSPGIARTNSLSLSKEMPSHAVNGSAMASIETAIGNVLVSNNSGGNGGGPETPSQPLSVSRRRGLMSPPSMRVSFSRNSYSPVKKYSGPELAAAASTKAFGVWLPSPAASAAEAPAGCTPCTKAVDEVNSHFFARRSPPPADPDTSGGNCGDTPAVTGFFATVAGGAANNSAVTHATFAAGGERTDAHKGARRGPVMEAAENAPATPMDYVSRWKASSAAAGASMPSFEGSIFAFSSRYGRSMMSSNSLSFEFSSTSHTVSAMSQGELMLSGRAMESVTPTQWALDEVVSASQFDYGDIVSEDNDDGGGINEEAEEGNNSDEDANEAEAFKQDITHVEEGGAEPACFGAAAHLLRGEGALITKEGALPILQRVGRGYLCRRHQHFLFMVSISFAEVAAIQRVAVAYLVRRKMGLEFHVNRLVMEEVAHWELRNRAAIKLHAVVRGFIARQRVERLKRKLFTRIELRTALELPDPDE